MNVAVGMQTSARIYFQFSICIWALINMGESLTMIAGSFIAIEGLTVTYVIYFYLGDGVMLIEE